MKIKLNANNLRKKIKDIRDLADRAETAKKKIDEAFERESDPVSPDDFLTQSNDGIQRVRTVADRVEKSMNTIISLNENGVGKMEGDDYTLDIPDDAHVTDSNSLEDWAGKEQAKVDAEELKQYTIEKHVRTKRKYDDIIASIERNKTNPRYAESFVDSVGAENLTQIPLNAYTYGRELDQRHPKTPSYLAALLGDVLSAASRKWDDGKSSDMAKKILGSTNDRQYFERTKVLNAMMGGHDSDGNGVNDLKFGKSFLVSMATEAEKVDRGTFTKDPAPYIRSMPDDKILNQQSADPLAGILDAMGNNDEAALEFLAPPKSGEPGIADTTRLDRLTHRWDNLQANKVNEHGRDGFSGLTAAIAAASQKRASTNTAERSRADMLSDDAIHFVAGNVNKDLYSDSSKKRLAVLLANCSGEVTASWSTTGGQLAATDESPFNKATGDDLNKLAYRIVDNRDAASTLSAGLADYAKRKSQNDLKNTQDQPEGERLKKVQAAYGDGIKAMSHLQGLGEIRAQQLKEDKDAAEAAAKESTTTAVNVFSAVLSTGLGAVGGPAGTAVTTAAPAVTAFVNPIIIDNIAGDAGKAKKVISSNVPDGKEAIWAASVQDAANAGLLQESGFSTPVKHRDKDGNDVETPAHDYYKWIVPKPGGGYTIDLSKGDENAAKEVGTWAKAARNATENRNVGDGEQPPIDKNLSFLEPDGKTGDGKAEGETAGRSLKSNGG